jgi:hypothetical protein
MQEGEVRKLLTSHVNSCGVCTVVVQITTKRRYLKHKETEFFQFFFCSKYLSE